MGEDHNENRAIHSEATHHPSIPREIKKEQTNNNEQTNITSNEVSLIQALHDTMVLNRLPRPEPSVFSGDPLKFIERSTSFKALVEPPCTNPADRLFYLQKYIDGEARSVLEGRFYRKDDEAYNQA